MKSLRFFFTCALLAYNTQHLLFAQQYQPQNIVVESNSGDQHEGEYLIFS